MRGPTVKDIAQRLNISQSTVSRVLNGSPLVAEETRALIESTAAELGYQKRLIRRHAPRSILVIALFLPRSGDVYHRLFYDPAELLAGISDGFGEIRTQVTVSVNQPEPELFTSKKSGNIDACIFGFTTPTEDVGTLLRSRAIPTVLLNRESDTYGFVTADHFSGINALLERAAQSRRAVKPCYLSFTPAEPVASSREQAFTAACAERGIGTEDRTIIRIDKIEQIDAAMMRTIVKSYNTLLCFNDFVAVYAFQTALAARIVVPDKLGIAGYDDSPVRRLTPQRIDTVTLSPYQLGLEAAQWLREQIIDRSSERIHHHIAGDLVPGETLVAK